jgi:hypothetical protein
MHISYGHNNFSNVIITMGVYRSLADINSLTPIWVRVVTKNFRAGT